MTNKFISSVWNFKELKSTETSYATHDFLRWYGKLVPQLARKLINMYSEEGDLVLANFAGSGTVLVEANVLKRNSIGIDTSPLSILLCQVKTTPLLPDIKNILEFIDKLDVENRDFKDLMNFIDKGRSFSENSDEALKYTEPIFPMDEVDLKWYNKRSFRDLMILKSYINTIKNEQEQRFYLIGLASMVRKVSRVDSRCVNHIVVNSNKKQENIFTEFKKKILVMMASMKEFMNLATESKIEIHHGDARNLDMLKKDSIDLIVSHPPYLGNVNYPSIFRLENKLLGYDYEELKQMDISTNSLSKYLNDMHQIFDEMWRVLKPSKYACVIIGDNRKDGEIVPAFSYFIQYALEIGFKLVDIFIWILNQKAGMSIKRRGNHIDHNYILIFQKPL